jgi:hypothetical protein
MRAEESIQQLPESQGLQSFKIMLQNHRLSWVSVAHTCNPNYSESRDQEDDGSKPAWANNLRDPVSKKYFTKKGW